MSLEPIQKTGDIGLISPCESLKIQTLVTQLQ